MSRERERERSTRDREALGYLAAYRRSKGAWWDERERRLLVGALPVGPARVLDAGAGVGRLTGTLVGRGYAVDAVDLSLASLRVLATSWPATARVHAAVCDLAVGIPIRSAVYGAAVCAQVVQHIRGRDARVRAWSEIRRACRKGAILSATVYHRKPGDASDGVFDQGPAYHRYTLSDLGAELSDSGWHVEHQRLCYRFEWKRLPQWLAAALDEALSRGHILDRMGTYIHVVATNA